MPLARHGSDLPAVVRAFASQIHPVFMLPAVASSAFGAVLTGSLATRPLVAHLLAVFLGLYTAHVKDGYIDFHVRGEDDDHPLTAKGCRLALAGASVLFLAALGALYALVGIGAVVLSLPGWFIGYFHAPQMDMNPVTATLGYPTGIALALLGGYYVQAGRLASVPLGFASVFLLILAGIKVIDDSKDYEYDRSIGKRTVAVVLGMQTARQFAYGLMALGMGVVVGLALVGVFPPSATAAVVAFGLVAVVARRAEPELATMLFIRGSYLFLAVLVAAVWFRPLTH